MRLLFSKILSTTDVETRFEFPTEVFRNHFLPLMTAQQLRFDLLVTDFEHGEWQLPLYRRESGHPKPSIRGRQWREFAAAKGLKNGDRLILYELEGEAAGGVEYGIEVRKSIRLFGTVIPPA